MRRLYRGETDIDFIGRRRLWFAISGALVLLCLVILLTRGLNYGIEFAGGVQTRAPIVDPALAEETDIEVIEEVRSALTPLGAGNAQIQIVTGDEGRAVLVQTKEIADPEAQQEVVNSVAAAVGAELDQTDSQRIGSKWGSEITAKAVRALIIFLLVILAFISWRFEWKMALAAIVALAHDLMITAGVYSLVGFEVTPSTIVALLTILGYSLYDTVVVFDKVEENTAAFAASGRKTYQDAANGAMNQVFMRSLNTSLTTILPVAALLFIGAGLLGAETLKDLALALLIGIMVGTYSSIFVATPVLSVWKESEPKYRAVRERVLRDTKRAEAAPAVSPSGGDGERAPASRPAATRPPARTRVGDKKAKRRKRR
jgi:preprotein translocase subunit SecF